MIIPHSQLSKEALLGVIEEFVTREGTDYGGVHIPTEEKVSAVKGQLDRGEAVIVFDSSSDRCNILPAAEAKKRFGGEFAI